ncbi:MAG: hypothetical protein IPP51_10195 [Bacteroidetes bacterium]|nr:hypothetical protein [Bacteroidota bacterium]
MNRLPISTIVLALLVFIVYLMITPLYSHMYDASCWRNWIGIISEKGLGHCYESDINYLPGHLYIFKLLLLILPSAQYLQNHLIILKYISLLFDFGGALLIASLAENSRTQILLFLSIVLNISFLHNSMLWGQFDSVFTFFAFAFILAALRQKQLMSFLLYIVALNFKFQAILFFPLFFLLHVYQFILTPKPKKLLLNVGILCVFQAVILLPWILAHSTNKILDVFHTLGGGYNYISVYAGNLWYLMVPGDLRWTGDSIIWMGLTLKSWGQIMSLSFLILSLFPSMLAIFTYLKSKKRILDQEIIFAIGALSVMAFFFFNTQMHERYTYPAFLFLAAYCYRSSQWWIYIVFSIAYFLNNEFSLGFFHLKGMMADFNFQQVSKLYLFVILNLLIAMYWKVIKTKKNQRSIVESN